MAAHGKKPSERSPNQRKRHYNKPSRVKRTEARAKARAA